MKAETNILALSLKTNQKKLVTLYFVCLYLVDKENINRVRKAYIIMPIKNKGWGGGEFILHLLGMCQVAFIAHQTCK